MADAEDNREIATGTKDIWLEWEVLNDPRRDLAAMAAQRVDVGAAAFAANAHS